MMRGDIHYIVEGNHTGSEQAAGRPAIIVSNDKCNVHSAVVEVVFLTTRPKTDLPTHVTIRSAVRSSIALCEQVSSVSIERLGDYVGTCTESEMKAIDNALLISLALNPEPVPNKSTSVDTEYTSLIADLRTRVQALTQEKDMYKDMYDKLINNILDRRN